MKKVIFDNPFEKKKIHEESIVYDRQKHLQFLFDISNQIISPACKIIISEIISNPGIYYEIKKLGL